MFRVDRLDNYINSIKDPENFGEYQSQRLAEIEAERKEILLYKEKLFKEYLDSFPRETTTVSTM